jgi:hypothetical protein
MERSTEFKALDTGEHNAALPAKAQPLIKEETKSRVSCHLHVLWTRHASCMCVQAQSTGSGASATTSDQLKRAQDAEAYARDPISGDSSGALADLSQPLLSDMEGKDVRQE